jgi:hypothetical protein
MSNLFKITVEKSDSFIHESGDCVLFMGLQVRAESSLDAEKKAIELLSATRLDSIAVVRCVEIVSEKPE